MTIQVGDRIPDVLVGIMTEDGPAVASSYSLFVSKKVACFGLPGAFTKTCSSEHLPGFILHAEDLKLKGIDEIICLSVNDPWVMDAWGLAHNTGDKILMIGDGALNFTKAAGLELDLSEKCYGVRCQRFSMIVNNGIIEYLHFDKNGFGETSAERLLEDL